MKPVYKQVNPTDLFDKRKKRLTQLIIFIYILLLFEGAMRKWVFPSQGRILYFIRDPFVLLAYFLAFRYSLWPKPNFVFLLGILLGGMGALLGLFQILFSEQAPLFVFYGLRNYFLYLPLPFLMERVLSKESLKKIGKWTLYLAIPMLPLCFFQVISPPTSPINQGFGNDPETTYANLGVYGEIQRASGTFTAGLHLFLASSLAIFMAFWIHKTLKRPIEKILLPISGIALFLTILISGSRMAFFSCGIALIFCLIAGYQAGFIKTTTTFIFYLLVVSVIAAFLANTLFSPIIEAMIQRWTGASEYEGGFLAIERIGADLVRFIENMDFVPFWGYGIGSGSNAYGILGNELAVYAEDDWSRHIVDFGPFLGLLYLFYRQLLLFYVGFKCWQSTRKLHDPFPLCLFGFLCPVLFNGQISGQGTLNGYNWLFIGFCLVASKMTFQEKQGHCSAIPANLTQKESPYYGSSRVNLP
ncbi:O-antigen ligase family protein [Methylacidiphilum caldifontis]|uniref:O-antigen ligase family protein n=1 Tax=Methylacidiphilum caldifontis TaxID=2795386 RepID=UPI001ABCB108|nr:O-antigen ligase family protein [Methylacidiphilum caldifontis]